MRAVSSDELAPIDPDTERMQRFAAGDAGAFEELYRAHRRGVYNFCRRMLTDRGDAGEAMQEVFFKVIAAAQGWRPQAKFRTWLYTIARNHCHDLLRRAAVRAVILSDVSEHGAPELGDPALRAILGRALAALPPEQREVFVMAAYLELSFPEIAEIVGAPLNTTKS